MALVEQGGTNTFGLSTESTLQSVAGFNIPKHDYISCSYTGSNMTGVVYKLGGASGTIVGTLTIAYDGSNNITSITLT